jgi:hypothetical protein
MGKLDLNGSSGSSSQSTQVMNLKCAMMRRITGSSSEKWVLTELIRHADFKGMHSTTYQVIRSVGQSYNMKRNKSVLVHSGSD